MFYSHVAYGDESFYNQGRYRSIAIVTLPASLAMPFNQTLRALLDESSVREFKWQKLRQARDRFAAEKIVDFVVEQALQGTLRVDVLTWDTEDSRHQVHGRDDRANLQRMYYHLFKNALTRWPGANTWVLYPDENSVLDWATVQDYLELAGRALPRPASGPRLFRSRLRHEFHIEAVHEVDSKRTPLCQVADLFAGLSVFSRLKYDVYCRWQAMQQPQLHLFPTDQPARLSNADRARCAILDYLNRQCKARKLGVSLQSRQGLWTPEPVNPLNFWFYEPQHSADRAPTKTGTGSGV